MRKKKSHNPHISSRHLEFFSGGVGTGGGIEGARSEWS
jgi:hypothetical protein